MGAHVAMTDLETRVQGEVLELIRWKFSDAGRIDDPRLKGLLYDSDPSVSALPVMAGAREADEGRSRAPAVYVYSEDMRTFSLNPLRGYEILLDGEDMVSETLVDMDSGTVVVLCEGVGRGQAGALGWEVYNLLREYAPALTESLNLFSASVAQFSSKNQSQTEGSPQSAWLATVVMPWQSTRAWSIEETSP